MLLRCQKYAPPIKQLKGTYIDVHLFACFLSEQYNGISDTSASSFLSSVILLLLVQFVLSVSALFVDSYTLAVVLKSLTKFEAVV